ncbi:required for respiratory growth protein 9, mitochondrial-like [Teratosphaeria destructans]|uniref:Required for respiratory growth protein 9, mitochondrial-like n=1 Tax=Teratosphaeria destructans TaxID=418781 RepID=A0A9W7T0Z1_9PEZI|nr:required for respiratory growth protein 9, mitochondrial-like [Teratosphaeria destructans]
MAAQGVRPPAKWRAMGAGSERGVREERVPRRRSTKRRGEGLSWDEVVGDMGGGAGAGLAERLL